MSKEVKINEIKNLYRRIEIWYDKKSLAVTKIAIGVRYSSNIFRINTIVICNIFFLSRDTRFLIPARDLTVNVVSTHM